MSVQNEEKLPKTLYEMSQEIKTYKQKMYKVGFGPNTWGIISEDSLNRYSNIVGMEEYGHRIIHYIEQHSEANLEFTEE